MATLCAEWTCPRLDKQSCPEDDAHAHKLAAPLRRPLPSLAPTALVPSCVSQRAQALLALSAVDKLRVVRSRRGGSRDNSEAFVVELFTRGARAARRIPLATSARLPQVSSPTSRAQHQSQTQTHTHQHQTQRTEPALAVERRLAEFSDLRNALYMAVLAAHVRQPFCAYCRELINYSIWGNRLPTGLGARLLLLRDREETRLLALLESFAAELLERTLRAGRPDASPGASAAGGAGFCTAQAEIPVLVHAFLFGQQQQQ